MRPEKEGLLRLSLFLVVSLAAGQSAGLTAQSADELRGVWQAERYLLADGSEHAVRGRIFFAEPEWQVLFFVIDEAGVARRGSAEGGTYERTAEGVVFRHLFNLSAGEAMPGLEEAGLSMVARDAEGAPLEPTRVDVDRDSLILYFPSGNRMTFTRAAHIP